MDFSTEVEVNGKTQAHSLPGFDEAESSWLDDVVNDLNLQMREAAFSYGWHYVSGIAEGYLGHGYCSAEPWIRTLDSSMAIQGDYHGTMYPNSDGYDYTGKIVAEELLRDLYPGGEQRSHIG